MAGLTRRNSHEKDKNPAGACVKEKGEPHEAGAPIAFSAATGYESGPFVRTEYSGEMVDVPFGLTTRRFERIDWVKDFDWIRILCEAAEDGPVADYAIAETPSTSGAGEISSVTSITPLVRYGLHWGTGDHYFYALYPAEGMKSNYEFNDRQVVADNAKIETIDGNKAKVTGYIPPEQELYKVGNEYKANMNYAYMYAQQKVAAGSTGPVKLAFNPLVTAFEFTILGIPGNVINAKLTQVRLSSASSRMTGKFEAVLASGANPVISPIGESGKVITASLPDGGVLLSENAPVKFTFLALPFDQTELKLTLLFENGQTRSLELKDNGNWLTVGACKKVYIRNLGVPDIYTYILDHTGPTVALSDGTEAQVLYRSGEGAGDTNTVPFDTYKTADGGATKIPVDADVIEYALADADGEPARGTDGEIAWQSWNSRPAGLTDVIPYGAEVNRTLTAVLGNYTDATIAGEVSELLLHSEKLRENTQKYGLANMDLSMYDIDNLHTPRSTGKPTTANCYIVDRAGTYRFPVVYGNSIDWTRTSSPGFKNGANVYSYFDGAPSGSDGNDFDQLHHLQNVNSAYITTPYILDDLGITNQGNLEAVVVWEDVESAAYSFISVSPSLVNMSSSNLFWDPKNNLWKASVPYIEFNILLGSIDPDETLEATKRVTGIRQGNAVIALRRKSDSVILWSWHIWVTDGYDVDGDWKGDGLTPIKVPTRNSTVTPFNMFMPMNIGWCNNNKLNRYSERVYYVRVAQAEGNAEPIVFKVVQSHTPDLLTYRAGETYFQWGRKDPMIPSDGYSHGSGIYNPHDGAGINKKTYSPTGYQLFSEGMFLDPEDLNGGSRDTAAGAVNYSNASDVFGNGSIGHTIRNPYIFFTCIDNTHPTEERWGSSGNWMRAFYPFNLWNMNNGNRIFEDVKVSKTVYDPCPPGYSVPHLTAFSWFSPDGQNLYTEVGGLPTSLIDDINGDGIITREDVEVGFYFKTGEGGTKIFFPMSGIRTGMDYPNWPMGEVHSVRGDGLAQTAACHSRNNTSNFYIDPDALVPFHWSNMRDMAIPVRPAKEL